MGEYEQQHLRVLLEGGWIPADPAAPVSEQPDLRVESRAFARIALSCVLALAVVAAVYAYLASPLALALDAGALRRLQTVKQFFDTPPAAAQERQLILAIGDSVTIGSVDCYLLDELAGPEYVSYNLGSPSKSNAEYLLDLEEPLLQRARVVQLVGPLSTFSQGTTGLVQRRANLLRVLNHPLPKADIERYFEFAQRPEDARYLLAPRYEHVLASRWRINTHVAGELKALLSGRNARGREVEDYMRNVYHLDLKYATWPQTLDADAIRQAIRGRVAASPGLFDASGFNPPRATRDSYEFVLSRLAQQTQGMVLVIAPLHPLLHEELGDSALEQFRQLVLSYAADKIVVLDYSGLLSAEQFADEVHPNQSGAEKITRALAEDLALGTTPR